MQQKVIINLVFPEKNLSYDVRESTKKKMKPWHRIQQK